MRIAYLFSRYPVVSQTFCDTEILALEQKGVELELYSIYPPPTSFRHGHAARMKAEIHYGPPSAILKLGEQEARKQDRWPERLIAMHDGRYGQGYKSALRARNALYFADLFVRRGITHFHVHFANRAAHTAIFLKELSRIPFSVSTHGQDFMSDLGSDELLREICREAEFVANETEFSKGLVSRLCPDSASKMLRVFNGMELANFQPKPAQAPRPETAIVSIGRLIEFKGFHHLIAACAELEKRGSNFTCEIIGEGPWRAQLQTQIDTVGLGKRVRLLGALPQEEVFEKLSGCDIFALACTHDQQGASDVFPTVILEAMASAKPVVSTRIAGVPEQIVHETTGLLVEPEAEIELADALMRLVDSPELRARFGKAGRERLEAEFAVAHTVRPLHEIFSRIVKPSTQPPKTTGGFAVLLAEWPIPDPQQAELAQLIEAVDGPIYAMNASSAPPPRDLRRILERLQFLPDAMVLEAEWQQDRPWARRIETWRVDLGQKLATEAFLQAARQALYLRRWIERDGVRHLYAMTSRELLCAWMLSRLCAVSFSATIEPKLEELPRSVIGKLTDAASGVRVASDQAATEIAKAQAPGKAAIISKYKPGRALETEWIAKLKTWSARTPA